MLSRASSSTHLITIIVEYNSSVFRILQTTQLVTPPLIHMKTDTHAKNEIAKAMIAEIRAPVRKLLTKVPLLNAIPKPIIGHRQSEHVNQNTPMMSGEEG